MQKQIPIDQEFILLGVSLGGLIAIEINKVRKAKELVLISTFEASTEFRIHYKIIAATSILKLFPHHLLLMNKSYLVKWFGTSKQKLLKEILEDTDSKFVKWALIAASQWIQEESVDNRLRIHGDNDLIIPFPKEKKVKRIVGGGHFMIVDHAKEISNFVSDYLSED